MAHELTRLNKIIRKTMTFWSEYKTKQELDKYRENKDKTYDGAYGERIYFQSILRTAIKYRKLPSRINYSVLSEYY